MYPDQLVGATRHLQQQALTTAEAMLAEFALLTCAKHMAWMRPVTGRLESRCQNGVGVVYNTFPVPPSFAGRIADQSKLEQFAQAVLDARDTHPEATSADLYHPDLMSVNLC